MLRIFCISLIPFILFNSCARAPLKSENALQSASAPELRDDLDLEALFRAVDDQIRFIESRPAESYASFKFGTRIVPRVKYLQSLKEFSAQGRASKTREEFFSWVQDRFDFYEVYGQESNGSSGEIFLTSYFEPRVRGSLKRTREFTRPVYRKPADLYSLDLSNFDGKFKGERVLRARKDEEKRALVPYFTREDIDEKWALKGRGLEICWMDPLDAFLIQTQGSGTIEVGKGKAIRIHYADKNGLTYESIGKFLRHRIPSEQMNLPGIEAVLKSLPTLEQQKVLSMNPSYVFFEETHESSLTKMGIPATDGRTIATDGKYFPKGGLAFLTFEKPVFASDDAVQPSGSEKVGRFVLDQDVGGAITGGGRADLFWGRGKDAKRYAGVIKGKGTLHYLVPKER